MRGRFITFEGVEGAGKSTQLSLAAAWLRTRGHEVLATREPGGEPVAERIRALLLDPEQPEMVDLCELLLLFAARAQHIEKVIAPELQAGRWVLCDRFTDATFAYQVGGRGLPEEIISQLEAIVQRGLQPDLTLLLDIPVDAGLGRARHRGSADRFELEGLAFFERVRDSYLRRANRFPGRIRPVDASRSVNEVAAQIRTLLETPP